MLEASGFDFRNRSPQRLVLKLAKAYGADRESIGKTAYNMSLDLFRTFAPLKQTTPTMAIACVELSSRVHERKLNGIDDNRSYMKWDITRPEVMGESLSNLDEHRAKWPTETMLDLLDLYTHHRSSTIVGLEHAFETFISIRISLNQEATAQRYPRFTEGPTKKPETNGARTTNGTSEEKDPKSPSEEDPIQSLRSPQEVVPTDGTGISTPTQGKPGLRDGTVRFMLDPERVRDEKHAVAEFFKIEMEEYEVEIERERKRT